MLVFAVATKLNKILLTNNPHEYEDNDDVTNRCCLITTQGDPHVAKLDLAQHDETQECDVRTRVAKETCGGSVQQ